MAEPTIQDLINEIEDFKKWLLDNTPTIQEVESKFSNILTNMQQLQARIIQLEGKVAKLENEVSMLKTNN